MPAPLDPQQLRPESLMMSHGYDPFLSEGAAKPPIFMTSTFVFRRAADGEQYFKWAYGLEERRPDETMGLIYSRLNNPGLQILEERLALWDGAEGALTFASGMAAITTAILAHVKPGDVVAYSMPIYGGTEYLMEKILPKFGVEVRAFSADAPIAELEALAEAAGERLALFFLESPANPTNLMIDLAPIAALAARRSTPARRVLTFVDNTFMGPLFQHPLRHGADLVLYSATKFIGGHSDVVAGAVAGSREVLGPITEYRTIMGSVPDPFNCWLLLRSLETLKVRMEAQAATARQLATTLAAHPAVARVLYPALLPQGSPQRVIFERQCSGAGSIVSFEVRGGKPAAFRFLNAVRLAKLAVSLGGTETLVEHPATMTHADIPPDVQVRFGVTPGLVRMSVGLEAAEDLTADLAQALERSQQEA
ncbi:MAG: cystathionine gamma-synthase family protein [Candidatus Sericytochromatia bacterium]|nr:cystathionine gamma-synthase family protein [Candidatus Sericytochromatia bacterium]